MEVIIKNLVILNDFLWSYFVIIGLVSAGVYFCIQTKFVQFRLIREIFKLLREKKPISKNGEKEVTSIQALFIATAVRVGTGNIAGVAIAISLGGPGSVLWMWLMAFIGGASSFIESTLGQIYKTKDSEGGFRGGPAYYIEKGLGKRWLGILFALLITVCFGFAFNSVQANTIMAAFVKDIPIIQEVIFTEYILAFLIAILLGVIIFGGVESIAIISSVVVPIMASIYIITGFIVVIVNIEFLPKVIKLIFVNAFEGFKPLAGGSLGVIIMQGIRRGLFSNEAGMGSGAIAASAAKVSHPVKQGLVQSFGVFIDTIIICSVTAFIIIITDVYTNESYSGIQLVQHALTTQIGSVGSITLTVSIFFFAFTSMIGNYYYGESNLKFVFKRNQKKVILVYRLMVILMVFIGGLASLKFVWNLADFFMAFIAIINLIAILILGKIAVKAYDNYLQQRNKNINPMFFSKSIDSKLLKVDNKSWPDL